MTKAATENISHPAGCATSGIDVETLELPFGVGGLLATAQNKPFADA
jgi:hypothetical protein